MGWFKGGVIGVIFGLLIETILFFISHIFQIFLGGENKISPAIIIPFNLIANLFNYGVKVNYLISLTIVLIIFFMIGAIFLRNR